MESHTGMVKWDLFPAESREFDLIDDCVRLLYPKVSYSHVITKAYVLLYVILREFGI